MDHAPLAHKAAGPEIATGSTPPSVTMRANYSDRAASFRATADLIGAAPRVAALQLASRALNARSQEAVQAFVGASDQTAVLQAAFRETEPQKWLDDAGNQYVQTTVRVDNRVTIALESNLEEAFAIELRDGVWELPGRRTTYMIGGKGTRLTRSPSIESVDSEDETYPVSGSAQHRELSTRTAGAERSSEKQNLVSASLSIVFRTIEGAFIQKDVEISTMWNSGYHQHLLGLDEEQGNFHEKQQAVVGRVLPDKKFSPTLHAHSEVSMAADPTVVAKLTLAYAGLLKQVSSGGVLVKLLIRAHSSPNTVCMNACRGALEEVRQKAVTISAISDRKDIRPSQRFGVELMVTSDRPFMELRGNPAHKKLVKGDGEAAPPRGDRAGRVIEVLNDQDRGKLSRAERPPAAADGSSSSPASMVE